MLLKVILGVLVLLAGFLTYVAFQPSEMYIVREIFIKAPSEKIFPFINNSQKANSWMPWQESDPGAIMKYSGPEEGVGSTSSWDSPGKMGTGKAEVVESVPNQTVKTKLTYTKPMNMSQMAEVSLTPSADGTIVKWSVKGNNTFLGRLMCVFMNMDKMVGGQFEKGLTKLKNQVEAGN